LGRSAGERKLHIDKMHPELSIKRQAELLGISRASVYYQEKPVDPFTLKLMHRIDKIYTDIPFYGSRRITYQLNREGYGVNRKRIQGLMRNMGIEAIYPKKNTSQPEGSHKKYPYLLKGLVIKKPNHVWGIDITYIRLLKGWLYLTAILDWYSRHVVSWKLSDTLAKEMVIATVKKGLSLNIPEVLNSDQGSQMTSTEYINLVEASGARISMDGRGRAFDNIFTERLWRSVKYEEVYLKEYTTPKEAKKSLDAYLNFYNTKRLHQSLNYKTPAEVYYGS
jgi:putative transposase